MSRYHRGRIDGGIHSRAAGDFALPGAALHYAPDLGLEPKHLDLRLEIDLPSRSIAARATWHLTPRRPTARTLRLNANGFSIDTIEDLTGAPIQWRHDGAHVDITWPSPPSTPPRVQIEWTVSNPISGLYFGHAADGSSKEISWMCTDHETERARHWLPCVDYPNVRTSITTTLVAADGLTAIGPGRLDGTAPTDDGRTVTTWHLEQPCPSYLLCLLVGDLVCADEGACGEVPIAYYAPAPYTAAQLRRSFGPTGEMMEWMTARLGVPFPFPKYYQFAAPGIGGAMENISLTSWDDAFVCDEIYHGERGWLVDLINLHEMAHSYFGDIVVCRDYAHAWLKEGWATYMESVWLGDTQGADALHYQMYFERHLYLQEADGSYIRPIVTRRFNSSWQMYDRHLYPGAAWRVHMLRHILGEEPFWEGVKQYLQAYSGRVVETDDFRKVLEDVSGRSLAKFFDQWIYGQGYPKLQVKMAHAPEHGRLSLTLEQSNPGTKEGESPDPFEMTIEVALQTADGDWTRHSVSMDSAHAGLNVAMEQAPQQIVIDPEGKVLHKLSFDPGQDILIRMAAECPFLVGRIHAVETLLAAGKPTAVEALKRGYGDEPHWGVRVATARAFGGVGNEAAIDALVHCLATENDPRVQIEITLACGKYRDTRIAEALRQWLDTDGRPYLAQMHALTALGNQRGTADIERLQAACQSPAWWGWVRRGGLAGLGKSRTPAAFEYLVDHVLRADDVPQVRVSGMMALADCAQWMSPAQRERALEALQTGALDPDEKIRMATGRAIAALGEGRGVGVIKGLGSSLADQWAVSMRASRSALEARLAAKNTGQTAKTIESLEETVRKLEARVVALEALRESAAPKGQQKDQESAP